MDAVGRCSARNRALVGRPGRIGRGGVGRDATAADSAAAAAAAGREGEGEGRCGSCRQRLAAAADAVWAAVHKL